MRIYRRAPRHQFAARVVVPFAHTGVPSSGDEDNRAEETRVHETAKDASHTPITLRRTVPIG